MHSGGAGSRMAILQAIRAPHHDEQQAAVLSARWCQHGTTHRRGMARSRRANWKHGLYSAEAKVEAKLLKLIGITEHGQKDDSEGEAQLYAPSSRNLQRLEICSSPFASISILCS